jgi:hypothetical protein
MASELEEAWDALRAATPAGWFVGRPTLNDSSRDWTMYAFDPAERPKSGRRQREWVAQAPTEEAVVREMARCLSEIGEPRVPK